MKKLLAALLAAISVSAHAVEPVGVPRGFITGNKFLAFSDLEKRRYVIGVIDGLLLSPIMAMKNTPRALRLQKCERQNDMTDEQILAIVSKFVADHPESWGDDMSGLTFRAMREACEKVGTPLD